MRIGALPTMAHRPTTTRARFVGETTETPGGEAGALIKDFFACRAGETAPSTSGGGRRPPRGPSTTRAAECGPRRTSQTGSRRCTARACRSGARCTRSPPTAQSAQRLTRKYERRACRARRVARAEQLRRPRSGRRRRCRAPGQGTGRCSTTALRRSRERLPRRTGGRHRRRRAVSTPVSARRGEYRAA